MKFLNIAVSLLIRTLTFLKASEEVFYIKAAYTLKDAISGLTETVEDPTIEITLLEQHEFWAIESVKKVKNNTVFIKIYINDD